MIRVVIAAWAGAGRIRGLLLRRAGQSRCCRWTSTGLLPVVSVRTVIESWRLANCRRAGATTRGACRLPRGPERASHGHGRAAVAGGLVGPCPPGHARPDAPVGRAWRTCPEARSAPGQIRAESPRFRPRPACAGPGNGGGDVGSDHRVGAVPPGKDRQHGGLLRRGSQASRARVRHASPSPRNCSVTMTRAA